MASEIVTSVCGRRIIVDTDPEFRESNHVKMLVRETGLELEGIYDCEEALSGKRRLTFRSFRKTYLLFPIAISFCREYYALTGEQALWGKPRRRLLRKFSQAREAMIANGEDHGRPCVMILDLQGGDVDHGCVVFDDFSLFAIDNASVYCMRFASRGTIYIGTFKDMVMTAKKLLDDEPSRSVESCLSIRNQLKQTNTKQCWLAEKMNYSAAFLSNVLNGKKSPPKGFLERAAAILCEVMPPSVLD